MKYTETERWKVLRAECVNKADNRCQLCNSKERLAAHHRLYDDTYEEGCKDSSDLIALCWGCHSWFHLSQRQKKVNCENKVATWKGKGKKKEKPKEEEPTNEKVRKEEVEKFPSGLQYRLDNLIEKHIDIETITHKEYRHKIEALKTAILLGAI